MKKIWLILSIILAAGLVFMGCPTPSDDNVKITFEAGDGAFPNGDKTRVVEIARGSTINPPTDATRKDHKLTGWNPSPFMTGIPLAATDIHNIDRTYYAMWEEEVFNITATWDYSTTPYSSEFGANVASWDIADERLAAVKAAVPGSKLRLYFDATGTSNGTNRNNWGIGSIGTATDALDAVVLGLHAASDATLVYDIDVEIEWLLEIIDASATRVTIFTPLNNGENLKEIELLEPENPRDPGPRPGLPALPPNMAADPEEGRLIKQLDITYGFFGDPAIGKGQIAGADFELIQSTIDDLDLETERVMLRIYMRNLLEDSNRLSWGCGQLNGNQLLNGANSMVGDQNYDFTHEIVLGIMDGSLAMGTFAPPITSIDLNPYNLHAITLIELWVVPYRFLNIDVDGTDVEVQVGARSGSIRYLPDASGFEFTKTANHRSSYSFFEIDLGSRKLSEFKEIRFTVDGVDTEGTSLSNDLTRRFALLASVPAIGAASLNTHATGGSEAADQGVGSNHGYLAQGQVSFPMTESVHNDDFPMEIALRIWPAITGFTDNVAANALNASKVFLSIYEHANGAAVVKISNIMFVERPDGECPWCSDGPCDCGDDITAAKALVEDATFETVQSVVSTIENARLAVMATINTLSMSAVSASLNDGVFIPAIAGTEGTPDGIDGSFTFTITLTKGTATPQTTTTLTLAIEATPFSGEEEIVGTVLYDLQNDPEIEHFGALSSGGQHPNGLLSSSSAPSAGRSVDVAAKTVTVTQRTGTSQGIRLDITALKAIARDGYSYRIEYGGILAEGASGDGRLRLESPSTVLATDTINAVTRAFNVVYIITPENLAAWGATTISFGNTSGNVDITYTKVRIIEFKPDAVLYDMQNDPDLEHFGALSSGGQHPNGLLSSSSAPSAGRSVDVAAKTVTVTQRTGTSQGIRLDITALKAVAQDGYSYRIEYSGILAEGASGDGRLRLESPSTVLATTPINSVTRAFTVIYVITPENLEAWGATTISFGNTSGNVDITYTNIRIVEFKPALVLYDMQNDPDLEHFGALSSGGQHPNGLLSSSSAPSAGRSVDVAAKTVTVTQRTGTSQGIRLDITALKAVAKAGHSYRIEYSGILAEGATGDGRLRLESPSTVLATTPINAITRAFTVEYIITPENLEAWGATTISFGNTSGNVDIIYTNVKITEIEP